MTNVVITGLGIVSPLGHSVEAFVKGMYSNTVTIQSAPWVNEDNAWFFWYSVVSDFDPSKWMDQKIVDGTDLFAQWTLAATQQCVAQSGLTSLHPRRTAIVHGTSLGGARALLRSQHDLDASGLAGIDRKLLIKIFPNMAAAQIAMRWNLHGPQLTVTTACASSIDAIGNGMRLIQSGSTSTALG
jgi:3-oxoacyl-[acyl-carrier-protein] synthase II